MSKSLSKEACKKCIGYLLDKTEEGRDRVAAAESLMYCAGQNVIDALFQVLQDEEEPNYIREEAAGSLGTLWGESEIEYEKLIQIKPPLLDEVVLDFDSYNLKLDKNKLGNALDLFLVRYGARQFMA